MSFNFAAMQKINFLTSGYATQDFKRKTAMKETFSQIILDQTLPY
jgi:hypothetical protein